MGLVQIGGEIRAKPLNDNFAYLDGKLLFGPESNRPNPGTANRLYVTIDTGIVYADTGTEWIQVGGISQIDWANIAGKPSTFPPSPHALEHASGGSDPITPEMIEAVKKSGDTMTGRLNLANMEDALVIPGSGGSVRRKKIALHEGYLGAFGIGIGPTSSEGVVEFYGGPVDSSAHGFRFLIGDGGTNPYVTLLEMKGTNITFRGNQVWHAGNAGPFYRGAGSPEGVVTAPPGSIYQNTNGGQGTTVYYKASGTGNTGWRAIA